jgi:hypothetical protein
MQVQLHLHLRKSGPAYRHCRRAPEYSLGRASRTTPKHGNRPNSPTWPMWTRRTRPGRTVHVPAAQSSSPVQHAAETESDRNTLLSRVAEAEDVGRHRQSDRGSAAAANDHRRPRNRHGSAATGYHVQAVFQTSGSAATATPEPDGRRRSNPDQNIMIPRDTAISRTIDWKAPSVFVNIS